MLVLSRQTDESIMIGDDIEIKVVEVSGNRVRIGIDAPRGIPVHRKEVYQEIVQENIEAAEAAEEAMDALGSVDKLGPDTDELEGVESEKKEGEDEDKNANTSSDDSSEDANNSNHGGN